MEAPLQRLVSRAGRAKKQLAKKALKKETTKHLDEKWNYNQQTQMRNAIVKEMNNDARRNYKEDYAVGGRLLPRRDIGSDKLTFATVNANLFFKPTKPEKWRRKPWMTEGDTVLVCDGKDKGAIAEVQEVREDQEACILVDKNMVSFQKPGILL